MKNNILIILSLIMFAFTAQAQEPDISSKKITWNCSTVTDNSNGNVVASPSEIISDKNDIKWVQNGMKQKFTVVSRVWNWTDGAGSIVYQVTFGDGTGTVTIQPNKIDIILNTADRSASFSLDVTNYTY